VVVSSMLAVIIVVPKKVSMVVGGTNFSGDQCAWQRCSMESKLH